MNSPPQTRIERLLHPSRAVKASLVLAFFMALPALGLGFFADDYLQTITIEGTFPSHGSRFDLYQFTPDSAAGVEEAIRSGDLPWWTQSDIRIHFLRPLSSALLTMDHALFGRAPFGYHLHSLVWYLALVAVAGLFFKKALPGATGAAALLLFAIDSCHAAPVAWIAARHALVSTTPALLGLWAHLRYREEGWRPGRWLSYAGLAVGLSGGETALGAVAYWLAYEVFAPKEGDRSGWRARLRGVAPILGFSGAYFVLYKALGCGARGNDIYIEPLSDPRAFALALVERVPILVGNLLAGLPADPTMALPSGPFIAVGVAAALGTALLYRATLPFIPNAEQRALQWLVPGALLSLVAASGGAPGARLLTMPSLGGAALVATLLRFGLRSAGERRAAKARGVRGVGLQQLGIGVVAVVHVALSALTFASSPLFLGELAARIEGVARDAELGEAPGQRVFVLAASDPMVALYPGLIRVQNEPTRIAGWSPLSLAKYSHRMIRTGPSSFRLVIVGGRLMDAPFERLFRNARTTFAVGDETVSAGARVTVRAIDEALSRSQGMGGMRGKPTEIEVQFDRPLEDPGLTLLTWKGGRLRRVALPEVGRSVELPWLPGPTGLF